MIKSKHIKQVRIINDQGNESHNVDVSEIRSAMEAYSYLDSVLNLNGSQSKELIRLFYNNLSPCLMYDSIKSKSLLEDSYNMSLAPRGVKLTGERIIDYGEIVTPQTYTLLKTYERLSQERNINTQGRRFSILGSLVVMFLLMFVLYLYIRILYPTIYRSLRHMVFLFCFVMVFVSLVYLIAHLRSGLMYLIPFALVPIVVTVFFKIPVAGRYHSDIVDKGPYAALAARGVCIPHLHVLHYHLWCAIFGSQRHIQGH